MKRYITSKPDIMGGAPCIVGTRVPIDIIVSLLKQGYTLKKIDKMYPWVGTEKLEGALDELIDIVHDEAKKTLLQTQTVA
jgi:uncharacterized protein (DUF433 family)